MSPRQFARRLAHLGSTMVINDKFLDGYRYRFDIRSVDYSPGHSILNHLGPSAAVAADDRKARGHRFEKHDTEPLYHGAYMD